MVRRPRIYREGDTQILDIHFQIVLTSEHVAGLVEFCSVSSDGSWRKKDRYAERRRLRQAAWWRWWWCLRCTQVTVSVVIVTTNRQHALDDNTRHYHRRLRSLACENDGVVVHWPAEKLTAILDRHEADKVHDVRWTLPYVSAATTLTVQQTQPVISVSLPIYSNHSHRSVCCASLRQGDCDLLCFVLVSLCLFVSVSLWDYGISQASGHSLSADTRSEAHPLRNLCSGA